MPTTDSSGVISMDRPDLPPAETAPSYAQGSMLSIKLRGHSKTEGEDYAAPALVLKQWPDGSLQLYAFDLFGQGFMNVYPWADVQAVLFNPDELAQVLSALPDLQARVLHLEIAMDNLAKQVNDLRVEPGTRKTKG